MDGHQIGRHAFAARFLRAGGSLKALKHAGGWEKLAVVDSIYGHLEQAEVHEFMRKLSKGFAPSLQSKSRENIK
jgi:site-specific recombinase XerD